MVSIPGSIGFLGFGTMGQAIAGGLIRAGAVPPERVFAFDVDPHKAEKAVGLGAGHVESPGALAEQSDILVLALKPQDMQAALESIAPDFTSDTLIVSIAAGISTAFIQSQLGKDARVVRVMPNTPALVGAGAAGISLSANCTPQDAQIAETIFKAVGIAERFPEDAMDAVTALSGSGPAYFFAFVEACVKAGAALGLPEDQASRLAGQTLYGAGLLLKESGEPASSLRERVTSTGGTTAAALDCFRERDLDGTVLAAMQAATERSKELGM